MRPAVAIVVSVLVCSCGSGESGRRIVVHVRASSTTGRGSMSCFLLIRTKVVGGGTMRYCLQSYAGRPGPNATLRDAGVMTFALPDRTITAGVHIVASFARDGRHASQRLTGKVDGGGEITGGGPYVEDPPGHIASSSLRYVITLG